MLLDQSLTPPAIFVSCLSSALLSLGSNACLHDCPQMSAWELQMGICVYQSAGEGPRLEFSKASRLAPAMTQQTGPETIAGLLLSILQEKNRAAPLPCQGLKEPESAVIVLKETC